MANDSAGGELGQQKPRVIPPGILLPFILVTTLFAMWGLDLEPPKSRANRLEQNLYF